MGTWTRSSFGQVAQSQHKLLKPSVLPEESKVKEKGRGGARYKRLQAKLVSLYMSNMTYTEKKNCKAVKLLGEFDTGLVLKRGGH